MKNNMSKLNIVLLSALLFAGVASVALANSHPVYAASFNNDPQDRATLMAGNYTLDPSNCCWSTNLTGVRPGDIVSFAIYYHNTGSDTARNVVVKLTQPSSGPSTSFTLTGSVDADNASAVSGNATVSINSAQTMTFIPGAVFWRANQCQSCSQTLPFGQSGSEIFSSGGLRLGDLAAGWPTQGYVVVRFQVSSTQQQVQLPTVDLSANPSSVTSGNSSTLSWTSTNATSCNASNDWSGSRNLSGSETTGSLFSNKTYTLTCSNSAGSASDSVTVTVQQQQQQLPTVDLSASPMVVNSGNSTNLSWTSSNATSCTASGGWSGTRVTSGSELSGSLFSNTTFSLTCYNSQGQSAIDSVTVTVQQPQQLPSVDIYASPSSVTSGNSTTLYWSSSNATSCSASNDWSGSRNLSGSETTGSLFSNKTYTLTCSNSAGSASDSVTVSVQQQLVPTVDIYASPSSVDYGNSSTLYWSSSNADYCTSSGGWSGNRGTSGSQSTGALFSSTNFSLTCYNSQGQSATDSTTVFVNQQQQLPVISTQCYTTNVTSDSATLNTVVNPGNNTSGTTVWFEYGRSSVTELQTSSQIIYASSLVSRAITGLLSNSTYLCRTVAQNSAGRVYGNITSFSTGGGQAPIVTTNPATGVSTNSATLNGFVVSNSTSNTNSWFEYGTTLSLGLQTPVSSLGAVSSSAFSKLASGLAPSTTYYFRAAAQNDAGVGRGSILSFTTGAVAGIIIGPTGNASISKEVANLSFPNGTKTAIAGWAGNTLEYAITVRNTGSSVLTDLVVRDQLSPFVAFKSASDNGTFSGGEVRWNISSLSAGESKRVSVQITAGKFNENVVAENTARVTNSIVSRTSNNTIAIINLYPLTLSIVPDKEQVRQGEEVTYTISYKNEGEALLTDAVLKIILPTGEEYVSAQDGNFNRDNNTVTFQVGQIPPEGTGSAVVRARVTQDVEVGEKLTAVAVMSFKDAFSQEQLDVKAYSIVTVVGGEVAGAAASFLGSSFLPDTLVGWLLLLLIILLIVVLVRRSISKPA